MPSAAGQFEGEARSPARSAFEQDTPAVGLHDVAYDRESEPRGSHVAVVLREGLEDAFLAFGRDARVRRWRSPLRPRHARELRA